MVNLTYKNFNSFFLILLISFSNQGRIKRSELDSFSTGHFLLTNLLLDTLKKTASESKKEGRIIIRDEEVSFKFLDHIYI